MAKEERLLLAILSNVNSSIRRVNFGSGCRIEYRRLRDVVPVISELDSLPEGEVRFNLEDQYQAVDRRRRLWVVVGRVDLGVPPRGLGESEANYWARNYAGELLLLHSLQERITLIRLMCDAPAHLCAVYLYSEQQGARVHSFSQRISYNVLPEQGLVTAAGALTIGKRADRNWLPFKRDYVALAHDSFEESFQIEQPHLRLLLLTISLEVLFNDGQGELTYKIARGAATLLGRTRAESEVVFKLVKNLYGIRSQLVHSGKYKLVTLNDVSSLRNIARRSIVRAAALNCDKADLTARLTAAGFGGYSRLAESSRS
jgi:hypothetical protein